MIAIESSIIFIKIFRLMHHLIEVLGLSKIYGRRKLPAVEDVSFTIKEGEILGFAGLNGAGKTTTINCMSGVLLPSRGHILVDGMDIVKDKPKASRNIGWVSEFPTFEQNVKPTELLRYFAGFYKLSNHESDQRITDVLISVGLDGAVDKRLRDFSQGMKKRFGLASAMISDPQNYLLDEILNGLDPKGVHYVKSMALEFKKTGKSVLLSTHILGILEDISDRIAIIHQGRLKDVISRENFRKLGKPVINLKPNVIDETLIKLLEPYGTPVVNGDLISITDVLGSENIAQEMNSAVVKAGYTISYLSVDGSSLEQYFLELTGAIT